MPDKESITATEAASLLGVRVETVYAYVSRGLIRSHAAKGASGREKGYFREDVNRLLDRKKIRKDPDNVALSTLRWGEPSLDSELTLITDGKFYYRGSNACDLCVDRSFEEVAGFFWTGEWNAQAFEFQHISEAFRYKYLSGAPRDERMDWLGRCQYALSLHEPFTEPIKGDGSLVGSRIVSLMTWLVGDGGLREKEASVSRALCWIWDAGKEARRVVDSALSLCLDHELNISSFTARCAASTGASLHACVIAALSSFRGRKHGANIWRTEAFLEEIDRFDSVSKAVISRKSRGESIPGFGHPLYPEGDPRAERICEMLLAARSESKWVRRYEELLKIGKQELNEAPNIDLSLALLGRMLELPDLAPIQIAAIGRSAGWIGHALEQKGIDQLIRPRARYIGKRPKD